MSRTLLEPILDHGIRSTHFFNGRLLSGEDLAREQAANRDARRRLGQAIGEGVAYGLEVDVAHGVSTIDHPVVTIEQGAAINRKGDVVAVGKTELSLVGGGTEPPSAAGAFTECERPTSAGFTVDEGAYVLVMSPAEVREGRAPVSGLGNVTASCNARYAVEGVRFRLVEMRLSKDVLEDADRLRNRLAYRCFGTTAARLPENPFPPRATPYGAIDELRDAEDLSDCDVPLALIVWTKERGIDFVDTWPVRRRLSRRSVAPAWDMLLGDRRTSEAEAMMLQFQDQIEEIVANDRRHVEIEAKARFEFLPPAGLVPIAGERVQRGFSGGTFFGEETWKRKVNIESNQLRELFQQALGHEPIDLSWPQAIQVYQVFDRVDPKAREQTTERPYVAFATTALISPPTGSDTR